MSKITILLFSLCGLILGCNSEDVKEKDNESDSMSTPKQEVQDLPKIEIEESEVVMDVFDPDFINGRWEAQEEKGFSFDLRIYVEDGIISGQYCAINEIATRIDCGELGVDDCYIRGPLVRDGGAQIVEVKSCYSGKMGEAELHVIGDQIKWTLMVEPGKHGVDHFAPVDALLTKVHFDPFE